MMRLQQNQWGFVRWLARCKAHLRALLAGTLSAKPLADRLERQDGLRSQGLWGDSTLRESNYWTASTAPAETLWQMVNDLADMASWHPLITSTNAPRGQRAKPGLIYRVCSRYLPLSTQIFVERVLPGELLSVRLFPLPGLQERVTYRIISTLCGTCVLYSMTLSGWLSPLAWPMMRPHAPKVAAALVAAAEQAAFEPEGAQRSLYRAKDIRAKDIRAKDIFGSSI
jgi:hypothetical protein